MAYDLRSSARSLHVDPNDVRGYLVDHPDFLIDNSDILSVLVPPAKGHKHDNVQDFQQYMLTRLQEHISSISGEHNDLLELMQEHLQRQNKINTAALYIMDADGFESLITAVTRDLAIMLDQVKVSLFLEATDAFPHGNYGGAQVVHEGFVDRWMGSSRDILLEETTNASSELFGEESRQIRSRALVRLTIDEGVPPGMMALGHQDSLFYATGMPTEQIEFLGSVLERSIRRWLHTTP